MAETAQFGGGEDRYGEGALKSNTILMARYKILGVLGGGGQGAVYQARDLNFPDAKRLVAIKEMNYPAGDPSARAATLSTFRREANILATLAHPAIPSIYDFFDHDDRAYLVMEYINGSDLDMLLSKTKELPVNKIIDWAIDLCDVLHYLHHQPEPIIFRDVKPANIMIDSLGKIRLIDFGIAKIFVSGVKNTMIGTEGYSAPEQYKGNVTPVSDIYSLGATLHHILTRKDPRLEPPFSFNERPIKEHNSTISDGFASVVDKAVAMDPGDRFQSCAEMKEALEQLRYRPGVATTPDTSADGGEVKGTEFFSDGEVAAVITTRWTFKVEDEIRCSPAVYDDLAFIGSYDTNIWAVDKGTGDFRWKFATEGGIASSPVVDSASGLVLFGSEDHKFRAVNARTGHIEWSHTTGNRVRGTATVAHGHVFFGSDDGRVHALISGNGRSLWEYDMGAPVRSRPYVTAEYIVVGSESGDIVGLEFSGERKWTHSLKRSVTAAPFVDEVEDVCYVGAFDGFMYALDSSNGYSLWRFRTGGPIISSVVMAGMFIYFGSTDGNFYAVNSENSKEKWRFATEKPIVGSPVLHENRIYFGGTDGVFYCLNVKTGKEVWSFKVEDAITSMPYIADDIIIFGSMDQTLYALPLVGG